MSDAEVTGLLQRVAALDHIVEIGRRHDLGVDLDAAARIAASARSRLRHGSAHTVVALAGSTGSGKSSLLNALTGAEIAPVGLTRPTTTTAQAVVYPDSGRAGAHSADGLLDWLDIRQRHHLQTVPALPAATPPAQQHGDQVPVQSGRPGLRGLVLLDLPDFDSTEAANRAEAERLIALVDLMIWVTDPQKYADQSLHDDFLSSLAGYAAVIEVVLNKVDTLNGAALRSCLADLDRLLDDDGLGDVHPLAVSTTTGRGLDTLRGLLAAEIAARQSMLDRIEADLTVAAARLGELNPHGGEGLDVDGRRDLVDGMTRAVGIDSIAALVAAQHTRDATLKTGWPPLRWAHRFRNAPIASLPRAATSHVARAEVSQALRGAAETTAGGVEPTWRPAIRQTTSQRTDEVVVALDRRTSTGVQAVATSPRWWTAVAALHTMLLLTAAVGALWLVALFLLDSLLLIDVDALTPRVRAIPLPTLLLLGGLGGGLLLALLARPFVALGARRRARAARRRTHEDVAQIADDEIVEPLQAVLADRRQLIALQTRVAGRT